MKLFVLVKHLIRLPIIDIVRYDEVQPLIDKFIFDLVDDNKAMI